MEAGTTTPADVTSTRPAPHAPSQAAGSQGAGSQGAGSQGALRVGIDVTPLLGRRTGIGRFVGGLVDALAASDAVTVVPFAMTARGSRAVAPRQRAPLPARPARLVWERVDHPRVERWVGGLDVVHGTNYVVPPARCPRLVSVHDLTALRFPEMCTADVRRMPVLLRRALAHGAHVHTDSAFVAREVCELLGVEEQRVHTIHPGVPVDLLVLQAAALLPHRYGGRPYLLALGTVEPRKALPMLVRSFAQLAAREPEVLLVIAGADGWGASDLDAELARLPEGTRARVVRERDVDDRLRDQLLAHCHTFVYPSRYEGFGFPPLEAMAAGRPVVATDAGSLPEVLGDAAILVPADDVDALTSALLRSLSDDAERAELVARGRERVARYDWQRTADELTALYRELAA